MKTQSVVNQIMNIWADGKGGWKEGISEHGKNIYEIAEEVGLEIKPKTYQSFLIKYQLYSEIRRATKKFLEKHGVNFGCISITKDGPGVYGIAKTADEHVHICNSQATRYENSKWKLEKTKMILSHQLEKMNGHDKEGRLLLLGALGKKVGRKRHDRKR